MEHLRLSVHRLCTSQSFVIELAAFKVLSFVYKTLRRFRSAVVERTTADDPPENGDSESGANFNNCAIRWATDPHAPPSLFLALATWLDICRNSDKWVFFLSLKHAGKGLGLAATIPVESFLAVATQKLFLSASIEVLHLDADTNILAHLPARLSLPVVEGEETTDVSMPPRSLANAFETSTASLDVHIKCASFSVLMMYK